MLDMTDVNDARLKRLNISIIDTGTHIMVVEYPPTPNGYNSTILYRAKHKEEK